MKRDALGNIFITFMALLSVALVVLYITLAWKTLPSGRLAQGQATPILVEATPVPTAIATMPLPTATVPLPTPSIEPEPTGDAFPIPVPPTPIPTPDVWATTVPELDNIAFLNPRPLPLPMKDHVSFGAVAWSPDSKRYVGTFLTAETLWVGDGGYSVSDLYMGNADTGELALWQRNGDWVAWSRDGRSVYYLALRSDGQRFYFDLYRRAVDSEESELVVQDVGDTGTQPSAMETKDGSLLMLNREHQPVLLRLADGKAEFLPLASLIGRNEIPGRETYLSLAPDGHTVAVIPYGKPFFIIDLATNQIVAELSDTANYYSNVAWSTDSSRLAYASHNGVFIYDLPTGQTRTLVTRQELGFPEDDPRSESVFGVPVWSPDERLVLFAARTPSWGDMTSMEGSHWRNFLFAAISDGSHWKALSRYLIDAIAPDKARAIVSEWNPEMQRETKYLVDVEWK